MADFNQIRVLHWCIGLELRPGRWHSSLEIDYFLERLFPRVERLVAPSLAVLLRKDSGFDSASIPRYW